MGTRCAHPSSLTKEEKSRRNEKEKRERERERERESSWFHIDRFLLAIPIVEIWKHHMHAWCMHQAIQFIQSDGRHFKTSSLRFLFSFLDVKWKLICHWLVGWLVGWGWPAVLSFAISLSVVVEIGQVQSVSDASSARLHRSVIKSGGSKVTQLKTKS